MTGLLLHFLIPAIVLKAVGYVYPAVVVDGWDSLMVASLVLGLWSLVVRPVVRLLSLPINILTLGLFGVALNVGAVWLTAELVDGFSTGGIAGAAICAVAIGIATSLVR